MPRVYKPSAKKRYKKYDPDIIKKALKELETPNSVLSIVAKKYEIHKSVLYRHSIKTMKKQGGQTALSEEIEVILIDYLNKCAEWSYPMDTLDLRYIIKMYLDKSGIQHKKFKNNLPGPDFIYGFLKRNKDKVANRIVENIKRARAEISPNIIRDYFKELEKSLEGVLPSNIINYDETNLTDDPGRTKALVRRGCKYPERKLNSTKASVSIMMAGSAEGELLPPYVVYKAKYLYDTWVENGPEGARYNRSTSGWFEGVIFEDWVLNVVIPYFKDKPGRKCLIGDNLSSHISVSLIQICKDHNIDFVFLPANSTHLTQPLDVAFFRPMKIAWRKNLLLWKKTDGRNLSTIPKGCFPKLLKRLIDEIKINSKNNMLAGFRKTGINPLNANEVLSRLPSEPPSMSEYENQQIIEDAVLSLLKEMRYGTMNITDQNRKRKLNVVAGKSVCSEAIDVTNIITTVKKKKKASTAPSAAAEPCEPSTSDIAKPSTSNSNENKKNNRKEVENKTKIQNLSDISKTNKGKGIGKKTKTLKRDSVEIKKERNVNKWKNANERTDVFDEERNIEKVNEKWQDENEKIHICSEVENNMLQSQEFNIASMPLLFFDDIACEEIVQFSDLEYLKENEIPKTDTDECKGNKNSNVKIISQKVFENTHVGKKILMKDCKVVPLHNRLQLPKKTYSNKPHAKPTTTMHNKTNFYSNKEEIVKALMEDDSE